MIASLVIFGATGDLAGRYLLPALATLHAADLLPDDLRVVSSARDDWDDERFRRHARERLEEHAPLVAPAALNAFVGALRYHPADLGDPASVARVVEVATGGADRPVAAYLALPPAVFPTVVASLGAVGLADGSRVVIEKPFGEDLEGAVALNAQLADVFGDAIEEIVFRVDHVLGMATVDNLVALRFANPVVEAVWGGAHVERVEVLWEETLALEGRAGFYDAAGALRDVVQNHVLQVLCHVAMERPVGAPHGARLDVLRAARPAPAGDGAAASRRARYTAGRLADDDDGGGRTVPAYADEPGVDASRGTETYTEVALELDVERWASTRFVLRAGKALAEPRKGVLVHFREGAGPDGAGPAPAARLWIGIDGPRDIALHLTGAVPGRPAPVTLAAPAPAAELPPYAEVLLDVLRGGHDRAVRGDEAEEAWRVLTPVLDAWADGRVPLEEYPAGSTGPPHLRE